MRFAHIETWLVLIKRALLIAIILLLSETPAFAAEDRPLFGNYAIKSNFQGKNHLPVLTTAQDDDYRTMVRIAEQRILDELEGKQPRAKERGREMEMRPPWEDGRDGGRRL